MAAIAELFASGGPWMYLIVPFSIIASLFSILTLLLSAVLNRGSLLFVFGVITLSAAAIILAMGGAAWYIEGLQLKQAIVGTRAENPETWELGLYMARIPFKAAVVGAILPIVSGIFAVFRSRRANVQSEAPIPAASEEKI